MSRKDFFSHSTVAFKLSGERAESKLCQKESFDLFDPIDSEGQPHGSAERGEREN